MINQPVSISVIIPVYNEANNIKSLFEEVKSICEEGLNGLPFNYEIIIINDGSTDETDSICKTLSPLTYIRFRKNYGQTSAMDCGFKTATKEYIAALDGDGQNDPADIPMMLQYMSDHDLDVVSGWRKNRHDSFGKKIVSRGANILRHIIIHDGINDSGCTLKIYKRECFENLNLYGEQHRFIPALLKIRGFKIGEVEVHHRPRIRGTSKYNIFRILKGFLDMVSVWFWSKYSSRPLHLLGTLSLLFLCGGIISGVFAMVYTLTGQDFGQITIPLFLAVMFIVAGVILMALGLMSEMLMKTYFNAMHTHPYTIKEVVKIESIDVRNTSCNQ